MAQEFVNPYRPGAGHAPPYLAGREKERTEFERLLKQEVVLENLVLTGLRGVGKTVLLDTFKPIANAAGWLWSSTDLSETASISEENIALRIITDLAILSSNVVIGETERRTIGFAGESFKEAAKVSYPLLVKMFQGSPGLVSDRLRTVIEFVWSCFPNDAVRGIVLAYDEAQNLSDQSKKDEYPLSLLLDVFQSIQKKGLPVMLVLTGLPTLFPKLVQARTFAERMFRVVVLGKLSLEASAEAIVIPMKKTPIRLADWTVDDIVKTSGRYPYFIQFICREVVASHIKVLSQVGARSGYLTGYPKEAILSKLDSDFFAGRWSRTTDRQRELLAVIAGLENCDEEFTVQEIVQASKIQLEKGFSASHVNQMLVKLGEAGLVYKNRFGKYAFAVPLLGEFINRQLGGKA